jgi:guanylate kinase
MKKRIIVFSSPSGGGKTTIARAIMQAYPQLKFSVSATTRTIRQNETNAKDYYFLNRAEFLKKIDNDEFVEFEEIFGNLYGSLKSEISKTINNGEILVFDVDVKGGLSLRRVYPEDTLLIFIAPPSIEVLKERLVTRSTETPDQISLRLKRAEMEMGLADGFDYKIVNDKLEDAIEKVKQIIVENII